MNQQASAYKPVELLLTHKGYTCQQCHLHVFATFPTLMSALEIGSLHVSAAHGLPGRWSANVTGNWTEGQPSAVRALIEELPPGE